MEGKLSLVNLVGDRDNRQIMMRVGRSHHSIKRDRSQSLNQGCKIYICDRYSGSRFSEVQEPHPQPPPRER